jgi:predicted ATPase
MADHDDNPIRLSSVKLERFKAAFQPPSVPLAPFNLVIGRNGSGKSTLLEALQWVDGTLRQDARTALQRYYGIHDVINVRSQLTPPAFLLKLGWTAEPSEAEIFYEIQVNEDKDGSSPVIRSETAYQKRPGSKQAYTYFIETESADGPTGATTKLVNPRSKSRVRRVYDSDRLALDRAERPNPSEKDPTEKTLSRIRDFWRNAVFLRLSTQRLAAGSPAARRSFEPLLDEEGNSLPALLAELSEEERRDLVARVKDVLGGIEGIAVEKPRNKRDEHINYALEERIVRTKGKGLYKIPSWMLSEGTRRVTALFALLVHNPPPSLLCIEEIENGLDPWTVLKVLAALRSASASGVQVIITTHSPWLLDHVDINTILRVTRKDGETTYTRFADEAEIRTYSKEIPPGARYVNS